MGAMSARRTLKKAEFTSALLKNYQVEALHPLETIFCTLHFRP